MRVKIGNLVFESPIINASGVWCTTKKELEDLVKSETGGVVFKTMTLEPRQGNPEPRFYLNNLFSINSMGLPNLGVEYYCSIVAGLKKFNKPLIASIAGFKENEFYKLVEKINNYSFDGIEVNLSCPNLAGKTIFAYDKRTSFKILNNVRKSTDKIVGVKLPPYPERYQIEEMSTILVKSKIDYLTVINSYPLSTEIDSKSEKFFIKPNLGIGGLGGRALKQIALAQVVLFNHYLNKKIPIIGVGGIESAEDIYQYILAGASLVGIATTLYLKGPKVFDRLNGSFQKLLIRRKVKNYQVKIGKAKFIL